MTRIRNATAAAATVAICLAMAGCSGFVDGKPAGLPQRMQSDAPTAGTAGKPPEALPGWQPDNATDVDAGKDHDEAVRIGAAYVTADRLNVRLAPSLDAEITNVLLGGQRVEVLEVQGGWSRITRYYDDFTAGEPVKVARWVASAYLSATRPDDRAVPVGPSSRLGRAIDRSDDSHVYGSSFAAAARQLIERGECSVADFEKIGGWVRSAGRRSVYFTYCGGRRTRNLIFLDASSGRIFRPESPTAASQN